MEKFYTDLDENERKYLSLNFLLSERKITDSYCSQINIKGKELKAESGIHHNKEFVCMIYHKHISRYIEDIEGYKKENL